eukprot:618458-Rhodomonas_salina.1
MPRFQCPVSAALGPMAAPACNARRARVVPAAPLPAGQQYPEQYLAAKPPPLRPRGSTARAAQYKRVHSTTRATQYKRTRETVHRTPQPGTNDAGTLGLSAGTAFVPGGSSY